MNRSVRASIASAYYRELSPEKMVDLFLQAGFDAAELAFEHVEQMTAMSKKKGVSVEKTGRDFRNYLDEKGFSIPQGHLSFKAGLLSEGMIDVLKEQLDLFLSLGIRAAVIHLNGGEDFEAERRLSQRLESLRVLRDYIKGSSLSLCIENLANNPDVCSIQMIRSHIDALGGDHLGICLDTGHLHLANAWGQVQQTQREFILAAGDLLKALHIANNDGCRDQHLMPFSVGHSIHWDEVVAALSEVDYNGLFNLEIGGETSRTTCPFAVKQMKIRYLRELMSYMLSDEFSKWKGNSY